LFEVYNYCEQYNTLPNEGGILDQDPFLMTGMGLIKNYQNIKQERDRKMAEAKSGRKKR